MSCFSSRAEKASPCGPDGRGEFEFCCSKLSHSHPSTHPPSCFLKPLIFNHTKAIQYRKQTDFKTYRQEVTRHYLNRRGTKNASNVCAESDSNFLLNVFQMIALGRHLKNNSQLFHPRQHIDEGDLQRTF